jgi:hypothetical protein
MTDEHLRDRFLGVQVDATWRRKIVAQSSLASARRTLALAKIRCLPMNEKLRRLKRGLDEEYFDELAFAVGECDRSKLQNKELATIVANLTRSVDHLRSSERARLDRRVGKLPRILPFEFARPIVLGLLSDPLKQRRKIGLKGIRSEALDDHLVQFLWNRFCETDDLSLLKIVLGRPIPLDTLDPYELINRFDEGYWKMRVIEATLKADRRRGSEFASSHPLPFIWACGRIEDRRMISRVVDCLASAPDQVELIDIAAWALGKLGATAELARLEALLIRLSEQFEIGDS